MSEGETLRPEVGKGVELRGYELARLIPSPDGGERWQQVCHYRPDDRGFRKAAADGEFYTGRHPKDTYRIRPILSMPFPKPADTEEPAPAPKEASNG